ncbi:3'-5' exonuclease [Brachybacterium sp. J153]|uniref:3'-5' exonuclease n=1 Tax=Brachybacterium sp. J153 TaxID=3116488 RepID=UPI002E76276C|nr:3'-5' exonuclease [Brachybacterium sp. J153]MEE1619294.1 3'-5' exonuclease [Brachybacterium sp. J153]
MGLLDRLRGRTSDVVSDSPAPAPGPPRFAVIDVETTGLDPARDRILELAILRADEQGRPIDQWVTRLHPDGLVRATHIHGITDADVAHAPRFADLALTIGSALQGLVVVAHNAEFDLGFLRAELERAGLPMPRIGSYCTLQGSTVYLPQLSRRTLAECCAALGVPHQQAHSALGDAYAARGCSSGISRWTGRRATTPRSPPRERCGAWPTGRASRRRRARRCRRRRRGPNKGRPHRRRPSRTRPRRSRRRSSRATGWTSPPPRSGCGRGSRAFPSATGGG